jgi:hypothetical protein
MRTIPSRPLEQVATKDRFILAATHLTPIGDLADVEPVLEQMGEGTRAEAEAYRSSPELLAGTLFECQAQLKQAGQLGHAGRTGCDSTRSRTSLVKGNRRCHSSCHIVAKVTLVHRRDSFRAERILQERLFKQPNVELIIDHVVDEIHGTDKPPGGTHVSLRHVKTESLREVEADGVFVAIGHEPASGLFKGQLAIKPNGYIETAPFSTATSVPGVFAAGDVADDFYRQAVTAAGLGCMAAIEAERWLAQRADLRAVAE